jgi:DNA-binding transcriptional MerR regulator
MNALLTLKEAAEALRISTDTLRRRVARKLITPQRRENKSCRLLFSRVEVENCIYRK